MFDDYELETKRFTSFMDAGGMFTTETLKTEDISIDISIDIHYQLKKI